VRHDSDSDSHTDTYAHSNPDTHTDTDTDSDSYTNADSHTDTDSSEQLPAVGAGQSLCTRCKGHEPRRLLSVQGSGMVLVDVYGL
jgi:hypothetical protein